MTEMIFCLKHGEQPAAYICSHLQAGTGHGFFVPDGDDENSDTAWCEDCDMIFEYEGDWTDKALIFANFKLVCAPCFEHVRFLQMEEPIEVDPANFN